MDNHSDTNKLVIKFPWTMRERTCKDSNSKDKTVTSKTIPSSRTAKYICKLRETKPTNYKIHKKTDRLIKNIYQQIATKTKTEKVEQRSRWAAQKRKVRRNAKNSEPKQNESDTQEPPKKKRKISEMSADEKKAYNRKKQAGHYSNALIAKHICHCCEQADRQRHPKKGRGSEKSRY